MLESIPGKIFVVGVVLLISFIAYSSQFFIFLPAYGWWTQDSLFTLGPLNVLVVFVFYNYYLAVSTDPGKIPKGWEPPTSLISSKEKEMDGITGPRFCKSCKVYKPPRSHHCRYCGRCVLKMDHHCPWINNCVGHNNYAHFIRFIVCADIACIYVLVLIIGRVSAIMSAIRHFQFDAEPSTSQIVFLVMDFVFAFIVAFCVGILVCYQLYCLCKNQTSIEAWEREKVEKLIKRGKIPPVNYPFDIGIYENICQVLGPNPLFWFWPSTSTKKRVYGGGGDGLTFPVILQTDPSLPYYWPPRDPDDLRPSIFSSKYKRQQEAARLLQENPDAEIETDASDGYYDSGSFVTDSENDEYSIEDEEGGTRHLINHNRLFDLSGTSVSTRTAYYENSTSTSHQYHSNHRRDAVLSSEDSDDDDSIPLSHIAPRNKTIISSLKKD